jgi:iron uptake system EfeUOB component EfeO/EfeM
MTPRLKARPPAQDRAMDDPGLSRHEWESEWESLEDDLRTDPAHALPELDRLVTRMLEESGYEVTDPVTVEGDEREVIAEYISAHDVAVAVELDASELSPGDVASAINGYRAVFDHLVATRASADADLRAAEAEEA